MQSGRKRKANEGNDAGEAGRGAEEDYDVHYIGYDQVVQVSWGGFDELDKQARGPQAAQRAGADAAHEYQAEYWERDQRDTLEEEGVDWEAEGTYQWDESGVLEDAERHPGQYEEEDSVGEREVGLGERAADAPAVR